MNGLHSRELRPAVNVRRRGGSKFDRQEEGIVKDDLGKDFGYFVGL